MRLVLLGGKVVTGGGEVWERGIVVIEGEHIVQAYSGEEYHPCPNDCIRRLSGYTIFPGFIDCHVHLTLDGSSNNIRQAQQDNLAWATLRALRNAQSALAAGVTTLRDGGGKLEAVLAVRDGIRAGLVKGPRILACGSAICITGGHGWWIPSLEADGPEEVRHRARELIKAGVEAVKLMVTGGLTEVTPDIGMLACQMDEEEIRAGVNEAHKAGKKTMAHAHGAEGAKRAARAGVDSIDHGVFLDREALELISERGVWYTPTLVATAPSPLKTVEAGCPKHIVERHKVANEYHSKSFRLAMETGVKLGFGTDSGSTGSPHGQNLAELSRMVELGLPPQMAIQNATSGAASLLGLSDVLGTIREGKIADIAIAYGDAIRDIVSLSKPDNIKIVIRGGQVVKDLQES